MRNLIRKVIEMGTKEPEIADIVKQMNIKDINRVGKKMAEYTKEKRK